jgi:sRNA-binding carbon storage regulator CsrA
MKGLVLTRRDGERIIFSTPDGYIGCITVVQSEWNRVSLQLQFKSHIKIERAELVQKGSHLDKRA